MKRAIMCLIIICLIGCGNMTKIESKEIYVVSARRDSTTDLETFINPLGYEHFFVYGGDISFDFGVKIYPNGNHEFLCTIKNKYPCTSLEKTLLELQKNGIKNTVRVAKLSDVEDSSGFEYFDGGDFDYYVKTEIIKFDDPRFWDVFIKKEILTEDDFWGYRQIDPKIGKKYLEANQQKEIVKNELWNAIIWLPEDIVKEKKPDGTYFYKDGIGNKGYNPWRKTI